MFCINMSSDKIVAEKQLLFCDSSKKQKLPTNTVLQNPSNLSTCINHIFTYDLTNCTVSSSDYTHRMIGCK